MNTSMAQKCASSRRQNQRGFALLVIFLMAAAVALMLYSQIPRVAFERERDKEQLLLDRGNQFTRAIQLYYSENQRWPQSLDDLERTNNKRYLRRRYKDPYTGTNEWRIIHTNGTALTDSLVEAPPDINAPAAANSSTQGQGPQQNEAVAKRPSDSTLNVNPPQSEAGANVPSGIAGALPQFPGQVSPLDRPVQPGQEAKDGKQDVSFQPQFPGQQFAGQQFPGQPPPPGMRVENGQLVSMEGTLPIPATNPQAVPQQAPGLNSRAPAQNNAVALVQQLLTTPRQTSPGLVPANNTISGGIAGVASTHTGPSIKVYRERSRYEEWEFVYRTQSGATGAASGSQQNRPALNSTGAK